jgi:hypothetical protein
MDAVVEKRVRGLSKKGEEERIRGRRRRRRRLIIPIGKQISSLQDSGESGAAEVGRGCRGIPIGGR